MNRLTTMLLGTALAVGSVTAFAQGKPAVAPSHHTAKAVTTKRVKHAKTTKAKAHRSSHGRTAKKAQTARS
jgi:hypothetical protein